MSIIVQCGHELTRSEELIGKLNEKGLSEPLNSSRTDLSSTDVAIALDKIYKKTSKLIDNKLAESVAIDFLLTNLEIESWGWNSSKNLKALHFWEWLEPNCKFVLVFDHPSEIFRYAVKNDLSQDSLNNMIEDWIVFQKELLRFFSEKKNKCILLEGSAALRNIKATEKCIKSIAPEVIFNHQKTILNRENIREKGLASNIEISNLQEVLIDKLSYELLNEYPELSNIFEKLITESSIKLDKDSISKGLSRQEDIYSIIKEIGVVNNDSDIIDGLETELSKKESKIVELNKLLNSSESVNKEQADLIKVLETRVKNSLNELNQKNTVAAPIDDNKYKVHDLQKENKIILNQLYLVQKELEYYFNLKVTKDTQIIKNLKNDEKVIKDNDSQAVNDLQNLEKSEDVITREVPKAIPFGVEKRVKMELPYRIGASIIKNSKSRRGLLTIPKAIAMEYIDYNKNISMINSLPSLEEYGDFAKAEEIKQHLSYQIGEIVAESIKEPKKIITAPIKIGNRILFFKKAQFIKKNK